MRARVLWILVGLLGLGGARPIHAEDPPAPWFPNRAALHGLEGVRAKTVAFVRWGAGARHAVVLDRQRMYVPSSASHVFQPHEDHGIAFPVLRHVPRRGRAADVSRAKERPFVPKYLYFADVDNDGDPDAIYGVHDAASYLDDDKTWKRVKACDPGVRSRIYLNDGTGRFTRGPDSAFTHDDAFGPAMALAVVDVDHDGNLDLFEGREYREYPRHYGCGIDRLWLGDGTGRFRDATKDAGLWTSPEPGGADSSRPTYGVTHADWNNDGWPDLLALSYGRQWNRLWRNNGNGTFTDVGRETHFAGDSITHGRYPAWVKRRMNGRPDEAPFRANGNTFDCAIGDIDGDGDLDAFLGEIAHQWAGASSDLPALLRNAGAKAQWAFRRETVTEILPPRTFRGEHWNYGDLHTSMADFDHDGHMDLLIGSGDYPDGQFLRLYLQRANGTFRDATKNAGFRWEGCGGISLADFDGDGDLDILAGRSFMRLNQKHRDKYMGGIKSNHVALFVNEVPKRGTSVVVRLTGKGTGHANTQAVGARVVLHVGARRFMREVRCGAGLSNHQDATDLHFGLGEARKIDRMEIRWPRRDEPLVTYEGFATNTFVVIREGDKTPGVTPFAEK